MMLAMLLAGPAVAQPVTLTYEGHLTDIGGAAVEGTRPMTFRLYVEDEGGEAFWTERHDAVDLVGGDFEAILGSFNGFPADLDPGVTVWLAVQLDGDAEFSPRTRVGGALRAVWAARADEATDVFGHIHPAAVSIGDVPVIDDAGRWVGPREGFGEVGPRGEVGPEGAAGPDGAAGPAGPQGEPGVAGPAGAQGEAGPAGAAGAQGPLGPVGPAGAQGEAGPAGAAGAQGPLGLVGPGGAIGADGPAGPAGLAGPRGEAGTVGDAGPEGPMGPAGVAGPMGPAGAAGTAPDHEWEGPRLRWTLPDGRLGEWADLQGPAGPAGPAGVAGGVGPQGVAGPAGAQGAQGEPGPAGMQGAAGVAGPQGEAGPAGPLGPQGLAGSAGVRGEAGPQGLPANPADFTRDTDNDGFEDWIEVAAGTDHDDAGSMPTDADGDGVADLFGDQPGGGGDVGGGIGAGQLRFTEMAAGYYSTCGLLADGELRCFGASTYGEATPPVGPFSQIAMDYRYSCGLRRTGRVDCWGGAGAASHVDPPAVDYVHVDVGDDYGCAVREADGGIDCWGSNSRGRTTPPAEELGFVMVTAGQQHACGLKGDGSVICWGRDDYNIGAVPVGVPFSRIAAGNLVTCGVRADTDEIECWGYSNDTRDDGVGGTYVDLRMTDSYGCGIRANGTLRCWGTNSSGRTRPTALAALQQLDTGLYHVCALYLDGTGVCWGDDDFGQTSPP
jgi:hypothetical protein